MLLCFIAGASGKEERKERLREKGLQQARAAVTKETEKSRDIRSISKLALWTTADGHLGYR